MSIVLFLCFDQMDKLLPISKTSSEEGNSCDGVNVLDTQHIPFRLMKYINEWICFFVEARELNLLDIDDFIDQVHQNFDPEITSFIRSSFRIVMRPN